MQLGSRAILGIVFVTHFSGCTATSENADIATAERFVDAFYAREPAALAALMTPGVDADRALYYQSWAKAGNYAIANRRPCTRARDARIECAITVTDDIGGTLGYVATDTFHLTVAGQRVLAVEFTADDPPVLAAVFQWMVDNQPEVFAGPCKDMFAGGKTPALCVRAVIDGARLFLDDAGNDQPKM